jgi:hypothetical protein
VRWKRVRIRGGGTVRRCAKYGSKRSSYRRKSKSKKRKSRGMAKRGSHCVRFKRVYSSRLRRRVRRCARYA